VWSVQHDLSNMEEILRDVARVIEVVGLRWFERFRSLDAIVDVLKNAEEDFDGDSPCFGFGRRGSPVRNMYLGFTALQTGARALAVEALIAATSKGGFSRLSGSDETDARIEAALRELRRC